MIQLKLLDNCDEEVWDNLVASSDEGTIFHTFAWMRVIEKMYKAEKLPLGIFNDTELIGVLPLFRTYRGPLTILASPLGNGYGGPLVNHPGYEEGVSERLDNLLKRFGADYIEFRPINKLAPTALMDRNYTIRELQTYRLFLNQGLSKLWDNLQSRCRRAIRKAQKNNLEIVDATDKSVLNVYYEMAKDTYARSSRRPPFSLQDYATIWGTLKPYERIKVLLARYEDQIIAGVIALCFRDRVYALDSAAFREYLSLNPNNLLQWVLIEWGANNGLTQYDFMGSNIPRIAHFLESFGGELQTYTYAYKDITLPAYIGRRIYCWLVPQFRRIQVRLKPV